jgi:3-hydroxyacyl-[acyl-carrier-protein] dehydratase
MLEALGQLAVLYLLEGASTEPGKVISPNTIFFTGCEGVRAHRVCRPGDILTLSIKPKRMKMPLATFEGAIRVGQEKAAIAEEITLTFGYAEAVMPPPVTEINGHTTPKPDAVAATSPLRVAVNA